MQKLYSIQTADRVFETGGSRPVLLSCNDMNSYVCKYATGRGAAVRLMCEFIGAAFLKMWGLNVPDFALISVKREHIPSEFNINAYYFDTTCFGLQYSRTFAEVINFTANISSQQRKNFPNRKDLLYIALFDIWLANEDRNQGNYNLLVDTENQRNFIPIDHETILNTCNINIPICEITYEDSIINSPLFQKLFNDNELNKSSLAEIRNNYYNKVKHCQENTVELISQLPSDWNINKSELETKLIDEIFVDSWLEGSFNLFLEFLQRNINTKENASAL